MRKAVRGCTSPGKDGRTVEMRRGVSETASGREDTAICGREERELKKELDSIRYILCHSRSEHEKR